MVDDLINRQALIAALEKQMDRCPLTYLWGLDKAVTTANKLPAVDAAEVVRCKDCKHRGTDSWCAYVDGDPNFYCKRGERREENDDKTGT